MSITFTCRCGNTLRIPDAAAGRRSICPACSAPFTVPLTEMRTSTRSSLSGESDYPMPDNSRIPVRERSRFDGLTADDVQLRPHLADEDEEQREERQAHRRPKPYEDEEEDKPHPPSDARSVAFMTAGVFMMFGAGLWFRLGLAFYQPPLLFIAGLALLLAGVLRFIRVRANQSE